MFTRAPFAQDSPAPPAEPAPPPAPEQTANLASSEARERFNRGVQLYAEGEFEVALAEFERAYELLPNVHVLYNIGQLCFQLHKFARARAALTQYLAHGREALSPERVQAVERDLLALAQRTALVRIRVDVPEALVFVDGAPARTWAGESLIIDAGERSLRVSKPGHQSLERHENFAGGDTLDWLVRLEPLPVPVPTPAVPPPPAAEASNARGWLPWAITGALAAGYATAGVLTLREKANKQRLERDGSTPAAELDDSVSALKTWAILTDVLLVSTLASAGVATYLTFFADVGTGSGAAGPTVAGRGGAGARGWGVGVRGTF